MIKLLLLLFLIIDVALVNGFGISCGVDRQHDWYDYLMITNISYGI